MSMTNFDSSHCEENIDLTKENLEVVLYTNDEGLEGLKRADGKIIIPACYPMIKYYPNFVFPIDWFSVIAIKGDKDCLIDADGKVVFEAEEIRPNISVICPALFRQNDKWGIVSRSGKVLLSPRYDSIKPDCGGFYFTTLNGKEGFITTEGDVIEPIYDSIDIDVEQNIVVTLNGKTGYLDENGEFTEDYEEAIYNLDMYF